MNCGFDVKVRVVREYDATDLPQWLKDAAAQSDRSVSSLCGAAGITTQYWYELLKGVRPLRLDTLQALEDALGRCYLAEWRVGEYREGGSDEV